jgi:hypothetical protein
LLCQPLKTIFSHEMKLQARAAIDSFRLSSKSEPSPLSSRFHTHNPTSPNISMHHRFLFDQCISANPAVLLQDIVDKKERKKYTILSLSPNLFPLWRKYESFHCAMIFERYSIFPRTKVRASSHVTSTRAGPCIVSSRHGANFIHLCGIEHAG